MGQEGSGTVFVFSLALGRREKILSFSMKVAAHKDSNMEPQSAKKWFLEYLSTTITAILNHKVLSIS